MHIKRERESRLLDLPATIPLGQVLHPGKDVEGISLSAATTKERNKMSDTLTCTACQAEIEELSLYSCPDCWGPVTLRRGSGPSLHGSREGLWRFSDLLPAAISPLSNWPVGDTPLLSVPSLAERWGVQKVWVKNETSGPTHSFKDRVVALAVARARYLGLETLACTSTGNLGHALAAATARAGMQCVVLVPESVEPAKTAAARALGAKVIPIQGSYDDVNRVAHLLADQVDWGFVNMTLRPFYAEGSKTVMWEVLEEATPTDVVAPLASGSLFSKLHSAALAWDREEIRFHGAQPSGCSPIFQSFTAEENEVKPVKAQSRAHSLAIGTPADGDNALRAARLSGGSIVEVPENDLPRGVALLGGASGVLTESAGAVTTLGAELLADQGAFSPQSRVVLVITGDGLKGLDLVEDSAPPGESVAAAPQAVLAAADKLIG